MCGECDDVLGEEAAERGEVIIGDEPIADDDMAKAVEAYKRHQAYVKDYNAKPEVKAKRKEYMRKRNQRIKQILAKAKELGLMKENEDG
jgi:hypothetical protein